MRAVKTVGTKFNGDRGGHLMEYGMAPQVYNAWFNNLEAKNPRRTYLLPRMPRS